ncbi:DUF5959 family protein [Streptomyces albus]|uniref:DUF5959 family protein n=1 Tax=Streptomyces albus TaxID=1888 RepID=UPI000B146AED
MADEARALELVRFADRTQSVTVEVACDAPVVMGDERFYAAEIVLVSGFVNGRVGLVVSPEDLNEWERCLDILAEDEAVEWPSGERSAWLEVVPGDPVEVTVQESPSTQIAVRVPLDVATEWLEENRLRLSQVRAAVRQRGSEQPTIRVAGKDVRVTPEFSRRERTGVLPPLGGGDRRGHESARTGGQQTVRLYSRGRGGNSAAVSRPGSAALPTA